MKFPLLCWSITLEKGVEITFKVSDEDRREITEALANLVGNELLKEMEIDWRIFDVKLGEERFFKVCFTGSRLSRLHPLAEKKVREKFDEFSHTDKRKLLKLYREEEKNGHFKRQHPREVEEEYDLWQDDFWTYF
jgi:hypothetical protein